jgi:glycosyltransferase involved in cell wall biosynthesis
MLRDFQHIVVTVRDTIGARVDYVSCSCDCICLDAGNKSAWPRAVWRLRKIIKNSNPVLVHAHLQISGILARAACPADIPIFYTIHNLYSHDAFKNNAAAVLAEMAVSRPYHHLIGVSQQALEDYTSRVPSSGTKDVLYNFVRDSFFYSHKGKEYVPGAPMRCISIGNLKPQKNYMHTLENFTLLKHLPITLDIGGVGPDYEKLNSYVNAENLTSVRFVGQIPDPAKILGEYDVYIISSTYEGFGIAPVEAMAAGLPVVASDIPVFREVMADYAVFFSLSESGALARLLQDIYSGGEKVSCLARAGRHYAKDFASSRRYGNNLRAIYGRYVRSLSDLGV